jgi:hypothetical protein
MNHPNPGAPNLNVNSGIGTLRGDQFENRQPDTAKDKSGSSFEAVRLARANDLPSRWWVTSEAHWFRSVPLSIGKPARTDC